MQPPRVPQAQEQPKVDPALSFQQLQNMQQQGQQFYNLTAANSQGQKQSAPVATDFQVQIPVKNVKPPKNGELSAPLIFNHLSEPHIDEY